MNNKKIPIQTSLQSAQNMIEEGHVAESLKFLDSLEPINNYTDQQKAVFYTLKSKIHGILGNVPKAYESAEKGIQYAKKIERGLVVVDVFINMASISKFMGKNKNVMNLLEDSAEILTHLPEISKQDHERRMGLIHLYKGVALFHLGEAVRAIENLEKSINLLEKWGSQPKLAQAYSVYGNSIRTMGKYNKAFNFFSKSQKICENKESPEYNFPKLLNLLGIGVIYWNRGELQLAMEYAIKKVALARKLNNPTFTLMGLNNLGLIYQELGEWDKAIEVFEDSLILTEKMGHALSTLFTLSNFLEMYVNKGDIPAAQRIFQKIELYRDKGKENKYQNLMYRYSKAILLKISRRTRDLGIAQEIFEKIAREEVIHIGVTQNAILYLCEMLLAEFKGTKNMEASVEFSSLLERLQEAAEKHHSYPMLAETYVLDAELRMIHFDLNKARHSLTKAQQIAEQYGLHRLAIKISNKHDKLLQNLEVWEQMKKENASISERLEIIAMNDQISTMLKKKQGEIPDTSLESPILLIIMASSGLPLYTRTFSKEWTFSKGIFSGFLSAFNSFSDQIFSEGLDRANFGKYTILMTDLPPFMVCYVFKGKSFLAQQKFSQFNKRIHDSKQIWKRLTSANQSGQVIRDDTGEGLGQLVTAIF